MKNLRKTLKMIDVIKNSNDIVCTYNLISHTGEIIEKAELTKYEATLKNYAFALNRANKKYELLCCSKSSLSEKFTKVILPS